MQVNPSPPAKPKTPSFDRKSPYSQLNQMLRPQTQPKPRPNTAGAKYQKAAIITEGLITSNLRIDPPPSSPDASMTPSKKQRPKTAHPAGTSSTTTHQQQLPQTRMSVGSSIALAAAASSTNLDQSQHKMVSNPMSLISPVDIIRVAEDASIRSLVPVAEALCSISWETTLAKVAKRIVESVTALLKVDTCQIFMYDSVQCTLTEITPGSEGRIFSAKRGICGNVARGTDLLNLANAKKHPLFDFEVDSCGHDGSFAMLCVPAVYPISTGDKKETVIGVITAQGRSISAATTTSSSTHNQQAATGNVHSGKVQFAPGDELLLVLLAKQAAIALARCSQLDSLRAIRWRSALLQKAAQRLRAAEATMDVGALIVMATKYAQQLVQCEEIRFHLLDYRDKCSYLWFLKEPEENSGKTMGQTPTPGSAMANMDMSNVISSVGLPPKPRNMVRTGGYNTTTTTATTTTTTSVLTPSASSIRANAASTPKTFPANPTPTIIEKKQAFTPIIEHVAHSGRVLNVADTRNDNNLIKIVGTSTNAGFHYNFASNALWVPIRQASTDKIDGDKPKKSRPVVCVIEAFSKQTGMRFSGSSGFFEKQDEDDLSDLGDALLASINHSMESSRNKILQQAFPILNRFQTVASALRYSSEIACTVLGCDWAAVFEVTPSGSFVFHGSSEDNNINNNNKTGVVNNSNNNNTTTIPEAFVSIADYRPAFIPVIRVSGPQPVRPMKTHASSMDYKIWKHKAFRFDYGTYPMSKCIETREPVLIADTKNDQGLPVVLQSMEFPKEGIKADNMMCYPCVDGNGCVQAVILAGNKRTDGWMRFLGSHFDDIDVNVADKLATQIGSVMFGIVELQKKRLAAQQWNAVLESNLSLMRCRDLTTLMAAVNGIGPMVVKCEHAKLIAWDAGNGRLWTNGEERDRDTGLPKEIVCPATGVEFEAFVKRKTVSCCSGNKADVNTTATFVNNNNNNNNKGITVVAEVHWGVEGGAPISVMCVPVMSHNNNVLGVLQCLNKYERGSVDASNKDSDKSGIRHLSQIGFDDEDEAAMQHLAASIGVTMEHIHSVSKRFEIEEELRVLVDSYMDSGSWCAKIQSCRTKEELVIQVQKAVRETLKASQMTLYFFHGEHEGEDGEEMDDDDGYGHAGCDDEEEEERRNSAVVASIYRFFGVKMDRKEYTRISKLTGFASVAYAGRTLCLDDAQNNEYFDKEVDEKGDNYNVRTALLIPVRKLSGEIVGAVAALNKIGEVESGFSDLTLKNRSLEDNLLSVRSKQSQLRKRVDDPTNVSKFTHRDSRVLSAICQAVGVGISNVQRHKRFDSLISQFRQLSSETSLINLMDRANRYILKNSRATQSCLFILDPHSNQLWGCALDRKMLKRHKRLLDSGDNNGIGFDRIRLRCRMGEGLAGICAEANTVITVNDIPSDPRFSELGDSDAERTSACAVARVRYATKLLNSSNAVAIPIRGDNGRCFAVIEVLDKISDQKNPKQQQHQSIIPFSDEDIEVLQLFSKQIAVSLAQVSSLRRSTVSSTRGQIVLSYVHSILRCKSEAELGSLVLNLLARIVSCDEALFFAMENAHSKHCTRYSNTSGMKNGIITGVAAKVLSGGSGLNTCEGSVSKIADSVRDITTSIVAMQQELEYALLDLDDDDNDDGDEEVHANHEHGNMGGGVQDQQEEEDHDGLMENLVSRGLHRSLVPDPLYDIMDEDDGDDVYNNNVHTNHQGRLMTAAANAANALIPETTCRHIICQPVVGTEDIIGVLQVNSNCGFPLWNSEDESMVKIVAMLVAVSMERLKVIQKMALGGPSSTASTPMKTPVTVSKKPSK